MDHAIASLKRPHSTGATPFTRKRTIQPLHHRKPGADEEGANLTRPNFPRDGGSIPHISRPCVAALALRDIEIEVIFSCLKKIEHLSALRGFRECDIRDAFA
jgi:hypothetical protein